LFVRLGDAGPPPHVELPLPGRVLALPREQAFPKGPKVEVAEVLFAAKDDFPEQEASFVHLAAGGGMRTCKARGVAACRGQIRRECRQLAREWCAAAFALSCQRTPRGTQWLVVGNEQQFLASVSADQSR
jgi:hypothetical protein